MLRTVPAEVQPGCVTQRVPDSENILLWRPTLF